jgi:RecA-family ATPase
MPSTPEWVVSGRAHPIEEKRGPNGEDQQPAPKIGYAEDLDILEYQPVTFIVEDLIPSGLGWLAGKSKIGKSWLAFDLALGCAAGSPVLGSVKTTQCGALYVALEDVPRRLQSRMRKLLGGGRAPRALRYATDWPGGTAGVEHLDNFLRENSATRFVIVDPWARVRAAPTGRNSAYQQDYLDLGPLHALANGHNITLLLVTHTRKQDASDVMDLISGTTGTQGMADFMMVLTRDRGQLLGQLAVTGRDIERDGSYAMRFEKETGHWIMLGEAQEIRRQTEQDRIYEFLLAQPEPVSVKDIAEALNMKPNTVRGTLQRLQERGSVEHPRNNAWTIRRES